VGETLSSRLRKLLSPDPVMCCQDTAVAASSYMYYESKAGHDLEVLVVLLALVHIWISCFPRGSWKLLCLYTSIKFMLTATKTHMMVRHAGTQAAQILVLSYSAPAKQSETNFSKRFSSYSLDQIVKAEGDC